MPVTTSARNRLPGVVTAVKLGDIVAQIDIRVGDNHIVAIITREAAEEMNLQEGDEVFAIVKATEVMVGKQGDERSH
jgi:molybdopterin-binding protein